MIVIISELGGFQKYVWLSKYTSDYEGLNRKPHVNPPRCIATITTICVLRKVSFAKSTSLNLRRKILPNLIINLHLS